MQMTGPTLPLIINNKNKYWVGMVGFMIAAQMYLLPNHYHLSTPRELPMTQWDQMIPFIPQFVWIYITEYPFFIAIYLLMQDRINLNRYFWSFMGMQLIAVIIFWVWPTTFPRHLFPLPEPPALDRMTFSIFSALRALDTPANCAPSLHVSSVYLSSFVFLKEQREKFPIFFGWATLIALSTLPTKQHYIIDVILGLLLAWFAHYVFYRFFSYGERQPK